MGHKVLAASSAEQALELAQGNGADVIVLDVRLPGMDGLSAIARFREVLGEVPIIVMTAYGDLPTAVAAVRGGAFEYLVKPFPLEQVQAAIARALELARDAPRCQPAAGPMGGLVGASPAMQRAFKRIALAAASDACVLVTGESGTGKELTARAIHRYSRRAKGPFVAVNVAALSPTVVESELFGHLRGAFTGAEQTRPGLLVQAHGGTLFLDEVADIPLPVQVKLLRALEHGEVLPVGANRAAPTDFRIVAATHQPLEKRVREGSFRQDLYFRLSAFRIDLPPLRERREDIRSLAHHFLHASAPAEGPDCLAISEEAIAELERRPWYGNVRELRNAIEHARIVARGGIVMPEHLPPPAAVSLLWGGRRDADEELAAAAADWAEAKLASDGPPGTIYQQLLASVEPVLFRAALREHRGQCAAAARWLGLHRTTLKRKLHQYGIGQQ